MQVCKMSGRARGRLSPGTYWGGREYCSGTSGSTSTGSTDAVRSGSSEPRLWSTMLAVPSRIRLGLG